MINVLAELERIGWGFQWAGDNELRCLCPFHEDNTPSCSINVEKRMFRCCTAGCESKGDFISFLAGALKSTRALVKKDLSTRYDLNTDAVVSANVVEKCFNQIWTAGPLLAELYKRCITDDDIRQYRLGERNGRITIPVKNENGLYVNLRLYLPGAPGKDKMRNLKGRGKTRLFNVEQMSFNKIVLCGGEIKAIAAARRLNSFGYGCVSSTTGESNWDHRLTDLFREKDIWIIYDIDDEGRRSSESTAIHLSRVASRIYNVLLPLDKDEHPKGDINDFLASGGDLKNVIDSTPLWKYEFKKPHTKSEKPIRVHLNQAVNAKMSGKRMRLSVTVSTVDTSPYILPKEVIVKCSREEEVCAICPIFPAKPDDLYEIHPESPAILDMIARPKGTQAGPIKEELGIPTKCRACEFETKTFYNVEDARVSPPLEITNRHTERSMQPAICIGEGVELNETYEMIGRMHPHPHSQQSTLLISKYVTSQDALTSYKVKDPEALKLFMPTDWTIDSLNEKLDALYDDLEANITRIYRRRWIHLYVDLAYHSPLFINFDNKQIKGWVEVLIIGDSSQGKTETTMSLHRHYGLGEKVECKNATVAGLLGGLQQLGNRWFVTWGVIPTHDRRLVILEEVKGASTEILAKLTDMRSSGIAEIPKIEKRRAHARTRLIALSNPRSDSPMAHYNYGIDAIKELIGSPEDIRRFDACLITAKDDIEATEVNALQRLRPSVEHIHTPKLCRNLILWGWTREKCEFQEDATELCLKLASDLSEKFTDVIPIVDRGSMRYKLARLSAALAVRTFSTDDYESVLVRSCHIQYVYNMLVSVYSSKNFGYADLTQAVSAANTLQDTESLRKAIINTPYPTDFVKNLLTRMYIELQDLQDWCGWDRTQAQTILSLFVRKHAFVRHGRAYKKSAPFIAFLKGLTDLPSRPDFISSEGEF